MTGAPFFSQLWVGVERTFVVPILPGEVSCAMQRDCRLLDMQDQTK